MSPSICRPNTFPIFNRGLAAYEGKLMTWVVRGTVKLEHFLWHVKKERAIYIKGSFGIFHDWSAPFSLCCFPVCSFAPVLVPCRVFACSTFLVFSLVLHHRRLREARACESFSALTGTSCWLTYNSVGVVQSYGLIEQHSWCMKESEAGKQWAFVSLDVNCQ